MTAGRVRHGTGGRAGGWRGGIAPAHAAVALLAAAAAGLAVCAVSDPASPPEGTLVDRATGEVWACATGGCQVND